MPLHKNATHAKFKFNNIIFQLINQREENGKILRPVQRVPAVLIQDFLDDKVVFPLHNEAGTGFGCVYQLVVGRGSHSNVSLY